MSTKICVCGHKEWVGIAKKQIFFSWEVDGSNETLMHLTRTLVLKTVNYCHPVGP